jgi:hypothetical protein
MKYFLLFYSTALLATPVLADPFTYGPDSCEFQITFPEKPYIETKCAAGGTSCTEVATYTKVVGAGSSTNFRVTCNPITPDEVSKYTPTILEETLKQMMKIASLTPYDIKSGADDGYKNATALSLSEKDGKAFIYSGQIWTGQTSMFTIEAEMIGEQNDDIQKTFATILKNTYPKHHPPGSKGTPAKEKKKPS